MEVLLTICAGFMVAVLILYVVTSSKSAMNLPSSQSNNFHNPNYNVLLVIAHPDDECMFFAPTILSLLRQGKQLYVLCLTAGDFYKLGQTRSRELLDSCRILGIPHTNIEICENSDIKDDPKADWNTKLVADVIFKAAEKFDCKMLVTFDEHGVSGHANHISVHHSVKCVMSMNKGFSAFYLKSVNIIEKYCSIFLSLPRSLLTGHSTFISPPTDVMRAQKAMFAHWSQLVWFRMLYIIFSRYMIINTLQTEDSCHSERSVSLVVNADDFGYSEIRNHGIVECYKAGGITSATLMVNGLAAKHAVSLAQQAGLPLGLHLNLTEGDPVSLENKGTSFIDKYGKLLGKFDLREAILNETIPSVCIKNEIEAQLEKFHELTGSYPSHVDGHHHIHTFPGVCEEFARALKKYKVCSTRLPLDVDFEGHEWQDTHQEQFMSDIRTQSIECKELFRKYGIRFTEKFMGITLMGSDMSVHKIQTILAEMVTRTKSSSGLETMTCEFMVHPGYPGPAENAGCGAGADDFSMSPDRKYEMDILMTDSLRMFYKDKKIELCSFPQILGRVQ